MWQNNPFEGNCWSACVNIGQNKGPWTRASVPSFGDTRSHSWIHASSKQIIHTVVIFTDSIHSGFFQDISLLADFTIKETFYYYGQLVGMNSEDIKAQTDSLTKLLNLPLQSRIVGTLR